MAQSPAHRFGQIIGDVLEAGVARVLAKFARSHSLFLDKKGPRPCRHGKKCAWLDHRGNAHDLDFVLERGGTPLKAGLPVAFIETAWRRYTKHSRNKVQEIQGAIEPLAETHRHSAPFKGAVLAGVFTEGALTQLRSLGFTVLYLSYKAVISTFARFGINAEFDEDTSDAEFQKRVAAFERLSESTRRQVADRLLRSHPADLRRFIQSLAESMSRQIERIVVVALHGGSYEAVSVGEAIQFIEDYSDHGLARTIDRYEIAIRYSNGDIVQGAFGEKSSALEFLRSYQPPAAQIV